MRVSRELSFLPRGPLNSGTALAAETLRYPPGGGTSWIGAPFRVGVAIARPAVPLSPNAVSNQAP